jgi:hypothetical protein
MATNIHVADRESIALRQLRDLISADTDVSAAEIEEAFDRALDQFATAPVRDYVPLLVERIVRRDLRPRHPRIVAAARIAMAG